MTYDVCRKLITDTLTPTIVLESIPINQDIEVGLTMYFENLPSTPNTSSEYYMERAACAKDGLKKKNQKQILFTSFRVLLFFWFLSCEINMCGRTSGRHYEW